VISPPTGVLEITCFAGASITFILNPSNLGALKAIIGTLKKSEGKDKNDMLDMANGIMDYYNKEKSFAPKQAEWIANTSKALFE
jgi:hypothetical protein